MRAPFPFAAVLLLSSVAGAATLEVGAGQPHATIGAALRAARAGDTVSVGPGLYRERVEIRTRVRLVGAGLPRLQGDGEGNVIRIIADEVEVRGLEVSRSGSDMMLSDAGIRIEGRRAHVVGNRLVDNLFGIYLHGARQASLEDNFIEGRSWLDVGSRGAAIHLYDSHDNRILRNRVTLARDGIYFDHSDRNLVDGNDFSRLRYGIHYMFCDENRFFRNVMRDSVGGAAIMYTAHVTFSENSMVRNRDGINAFGLLLKDCEDSVAEGNAIVGNATGIFLEGAHRNRFARNLIAGNDVAVKLYASALDNRFTRNDFIHNKALLHTVGRAHAQWAPEGAGNYYTEYRGYDLDGDGRGDVPHRLQDAFEYLEGNHPLLRLYLRSAAAEALAAAEEVIPVIPHAEEERDAAPALRPQSGARVRGISQVGRRSPSLALGSTLLLLLASLVYWRSRR